MTNRTTVLAVAGAFALGALGASALADDGEDWDAVRTVDLTQQEQDDDRGDDKQRRIDLRDEDDVDVEPRDEDDDDRSGGGDTNSGGTGDGAKDHTGTGTSRPTGADSADVPSVASAPAAAPAPVYDDYSDDGAYRGGGSDYGSS